MKAIIIYIASVFVILFVIIVMHNRHEFMLIESLKTGQDQGYKIGFDKGYESGHENGYEMGKREASDLTVQLNSARAQLADLQDELFSPTNRFHWVYLTNVTAVYQKD